MLSAIIGWFAVAAIVLYFIGLFYIDVSAKKILKQMMDTQLQDESLSSEAKLAREEGFYSRIKWLRVNQERFPVDINNATQKVLNFYFGCWVLMGVLIVCWFVMLFLQK